MKPKIDSTNFFSALLIFSILFAACIGVIYASEKLSDSIDDHWETYIYTCWQDGVEVYNNVIEANEYWHLLRDAETHRLLEFIDMNCVVERIE